VLPVFYSDNYVSLVPDETKTISIEAAEADLKGQIPLIAVDGWNVAVKAQEMSSAAIESNEDANPIRWSVTGLPTGTRKR
jgi:beta-mannosidase